MSEDELRQVFEVEAADLVEQLAAELDRPHEGWNLSLVLRLAHTLKGGARMAGVVAIEEAAHLFEEASASFRADPGADTEELLREGARLLQECLTDFDGMHERAIGSYRERVAGEALDPIATRGTSPADGSEPRAFARSDSDALEAAVERSRVVKVSTSRLVQLARVTAELGSVGSALGQAMEMLAELDVAVTGAHRRAPELTGTRESEALLRQAGLLRSLVGSIQRRQLAAADEVESAVRTLRMVRMDSFHALFSSTVREMARDAGKRAQLVLGGVDTKLDRSMVDSLRTALIHLLRNAVSHGIEPPDVRAERKKSPMGTIRMEATTVADRVIIDVSDDGAGIDGDALRARAVSSGLLTRSSAEALTEEETWELMFVSGISTTDAPDELSGRGVGLDAVRTSVEEFDGTIGVHRNDDGGATFRVSMPLTRITTPAVVLRVGDQFFAIPSHQVRRCLLIEEDELQVADGADALVVDDQPVPVIRLDAALDIGSDDASHRGLVVLEGSRRRALLVDEVVRLAHLVLQPLAWNLAGLATYSACAPLEDGTLALVLDVHQLDPGSSASRRASRTPRDRSRFRVLVVDDSVTSRTLLKNILEADGYSVDVAVDAEEALTRLDGADYSLIVTDIEMPGMDGFELTEALRASSATRNTPIVICTSLGNESEKRRGANVGADAYVVKGLFEQDELLATVRSLLGNQSASS